MTQPRRERANGAKAQPSTQEAVYQVVYHPERTGSSRGRAPNVRTSCTCRRRRRQAGQRAAGFVDPRPERRVRGSAPLGCTPHHGDARRWASTPGSLPTPPACYRAPTASRAPPRWDLRCVRPPHALASAAGRGSAGRYRPYATTRSSSRPRRTVAGLWAGSATDTPCASGRGSR